MVDDRDELDDSERRDLERLLKRLPLRAPSPILDARIQQTLKSRGKPPVRLYAIAASAAIVFLGVRAALHVHDNLPIKLETGSIKVDDHPSPETAQISPDDEPVRLVRTLSAVHDDGVVVTVEGQPVSMRHRVTVQQVLVVDPKGQAYVTYGEPREEVELSRAIAF